MVNPCSCDPEAWAFLQCQLCCKLYLLISKVGGSGIRMKELFHQTKTTEHFLNVWWCALLPNRHVEEHLELLVSLECLSRSHLVSCDGLSVPIFMYSADQRRCGTTYDIVRWSFLIPQDASVKGLWEALQSALQPCHDDMIC